MSDELGSEIARVGHAERRLIQTVAGERHQQVTIDTDFIRGREDEIGSVVLNGVRFNRAEAAMPVDGGVGSHDGADDLTRRFSRAEVDLTGWWNKREFAQLVQEAALIVTKAIEALR